jgi:hypothetical protein
MAEIEIEIQTEGTIALTPRQFLEEVVRPNLAELDEAPDDRRRAFNAAAAVDALAGLIYEELRQLESSEIDGIDGDDEYREALAGRDRSFAFLRELAKAQKHGRIEWGAPEIVVMEEIDADTPSSDDVTEEWWDGPAQIAVATHGQGLHRVKAVVRKSATFLEGEMRRLLL